MTINTLTDTFSASGELSEQDLTYLFDNGVSTLINVRPDNEAPDQKNSADWRVLCQKHGFYYIHIPVSLCQYTAHDIQQFKDALNSAEKKVHSFCRTGARAAHLFALANKEACTFDQLQTLLKSKGYDLNVISDKFN